MALSSDNVRVGITGAVSSAASGTALPTDADSALSASYTDHGYVSDAGLTESRPRTTNNIKAFQNADNVRTVVTESSFTKKFVLLETKKDNVEAFYGATVDTDDGGILIIPSATGGRKVWVFDEVDGDDYIRTVVPDGEITEIGDQVVANGEPIGYEMTLTGYPSSTIADDDDNPASAKKFYSALATTASVATISSVLPSAAAATEMVTITGGGFTGVTDVKFGSTSATDFVVVSTGVIVASMPAGSAGAANVTVVNGAGASSAFDYTRGA